MREHLLTMLVAAAVAYLLTPLVERGALAIGAMTEVRDRDVHAIPTPRLGGLAMYGGLAAGLLVASELPRLSSVFADRTWIGLLSAGGLITLIGFVDDRWGLDALMKFAGQVAAAGLLLLNGIQVLWLPLPKIELLSLTHAQGVLVTVLLVVVAVNAVNFIDGLDGLAAGVVGIAAFAMFLYSYVLSVIHNFERMNASTMIAAILAGMCFGFLPHNFNPARIFMGDTGSMLLGLVLATSAITSTSLDYNAVASLNLFPAVIPLVLILAILAIPLVDLVLAVVRRTRAGRSPFAPDKKHLHHRLLEIGHSHRRTVLLLYLITAVLTFSMAVLSLARSAVVVLSVAALAALAVGVLVTLPRIQALRQGRRAARGGGSGSPPDGLTSQVKAPPERL